MSNFVFDQAIESLKNYSDQELDKSILMPKGRNLGNTQATSRLDSNVKLSQTHKTSVRTNVLKAYNDNKQLINKLYGTLAKTRSNSKSNDVIQSISQFGNGGTSKLNRAFETLYSQGPFDDIADELENMDDGFTLSLGTHIGVAAILGVGISAGYNAEIIRPEKGGVSFGEINPYCYKYWSLGIQLDIKAELEIFYSPYPPSDLVGSFQGMVLAAGIGFHGSLIIGLDSDGFFRFCSIGLGLGIGGSFSYLNGDYGKGYDFFSVLSK